MRDHMVIAGCRYKNIGLISCVVHRHNAVAFHRRLQCANWIHFRYPNLSRQSAQGLCRTLADVTITSNHGNFSGNHHIGSTLNRVNQRLAAAIQVIKLALGNRIVHVNCRESQFTFSKHLIQAMHTGCCLFRNAFNLG